MRRIQLLLFVLIGLTLSACDGDGREPIRYGDNNPTTNNPTTNNPTTNNPVNPPVVNNHNHMEDPNHGGEEEGPLIEVGGLNGSWRVVSDNPNRDLILALDLVHDKGETTATGDYLMGPGINVVLDGQTGEISEATFNNGNLVVVFNPTNDAEQVFTLNASVAGENELKGSLTSLNRTVNMSVLVLRKVVGPDEGLPIPPEEEEGG